ncbi:DUF4230 domain-containing protein [Patiriisocius marinus]|uniref:DUF4230 domain-containing protein n=1 Tax=Patiriisocius marinus TaxID=1397112 RepID=A0A5J4ILT4_9FLAO|nr:DUF4230 domain-containing protein [Patiriisocius marinus]GER58029.1 hypothetical protein ULMA_01370 [Patiriisocius marinus]
MRKILLGVFIAVVLFGVVQYFSQERDRRNELNETSALIEKELRNVGKLIVTEGTYSQIYTYNDTKSLLMGLVDSKKKALVVVNAEAFISYDLSKIETEILKEEKIVRILNIPEPELKINPDIEYYDITQEYLNQFEAKDYNEIKKRVTKLLRKKIEASSLTANAENRLISELQKIYLLTNAMGWTLEYNNQLILEETDFKL